MLRQKLITVGLLALLGVLQAVSEAEARPYGYAASPATSSQDPATACQPAQPVPGCDPQQYGCQVIVCPCPCSTGDVCDKIKKEIPPIRRAPACHEVPVCEIEDEAPPTTTPREVTIYRNCYVPLRIRTVTPPPPHVTPVNIKVKWREIHYLCDETGAPIPSAQAAAILEQLQQQGAAPEPAEGQVELTPSPAVETPGAAAASAAASAAPAAAPTPAAASAPAATASAGAPSGSQTAAAPQKSWVWLPYEGVYAYGYQREDGFWVIDDGSRRKSM